MWESESFNYGQDLGLRRGRERKRRADSILLDVKRQAVSTISPWGVKLSCASSVSPSLKFSVSALQGCFSLAEI